MEPGRALRCLLVTLAWPPVQRVGEPGESLGVRRAGVAGEAFLRDLALSLFSSLGELSLSCFLPYHLLL